MVSAGPTGQRFSGIRPYILFVPAALIVLSHIGGYGMTFDEARFIHDARALAGWVAGVADTDDVWFGSEHPSPAKVLGAVGLLTIGDFRALRILPGLLYALAAIMMYSAVRRPRGPAAGYAVLAALLLAPPFFAFSAQASNESVVSSLTLILLALASRAREPKEWIIAGFIGGLALGTKITALVGIIAVLVWALRSAPSGNFTRKSCGFFLASLVIGFLASWPVVILRPAAVIEHIAHFASRAPGIAPAATVPSTLFFGMVPASPWYYAPCWLIIGLPPLLILAAVYELIRSRGPLANLLRIHVFTGIVAAMAFHSFLREGLRHLLPVVVVVAVAGGLGVGRIAPLYGAPESGPGYKRMRSSIILILFAGSFLVANFLSYPAGSMYLSEALGGSRNALAWKLPVAASADLISQDVIRKLPDGAYSLIPGAHCDRPLNFGDPLWRTAMNEHLERVRNGKVRFTIPADADYLLVLGSGRNVGVPLLERGGITYVSRMRNPVGFELILTETGAIIPQRDAR